MASPGRKFEPTALRNVCPLFRYERGLRNELSVNVVVVFTDVLGDVGVIPYVAGYKIIGVIVKTRALKYMVT